jgi:MFS family permease
MALRNLSILLICQLISATGAIVLVTLGGIIGSGLADNPALATLPVSFMVISVAATTVPATLLMRAIGRKLGSSLSSLSAALAALLAAYAISLSSFPLFIVAAAVFGINMAFTQQYRYAAVESVEQDHASRAISIVLLGPIGGAFAGSELVKRGHAWMDSVPYAGTLIAVAVMYVVQSLLFQLLGPLRGEKHGTTTQTHRPLRQVVRQPVFIVAVLGGTVAYGVMTLIMTATPLSMHVNGGYSLDATADVIRAHVLGMYVPSLVSGFLIERLGTVKMMSVGAVALLAATIIGLQGQSIMHYWFALVLLGVGWNFLYVGGTTMLTLTYSMAERFKAQAVNEFSVFGTSATASLLAGTVIYFYGWNTLVLLPIPLLLMIVVGLFIVRHHPLVRV